LRASSVLCGTVPAVVLNAMSTLRYVVCDATCVRLKTPHDGRLILAARSSGAGGSDESVGKTVRDLRPVYTAIDVGSFASALAKPHAKVSSVADLSRRNNCVAAGAGLECMGGMTMFSSWLLSLLAVCLALLSVASGREPIPVKPACVPSYTRSPEGVE
jgi:hypothetical protein